jgi:hypothetical protein
MFSSSSGCSGRLDLVEGQGVLHGHGHLVGDLLQEVHIRLS